MMHKPLHTLNESEPTEVSLIPACQANELFLADLHQASKASGSLHLWWLGQSGFLIQWQGRHLLFDPYLSDSLTTKYAATDKPHVRMSELVVNPALLQGIDVVTSSHNHTDHLDAETLRALSQANPRMHLIFPEANRDRVRERSELPDPQLHGLDARPEIEQSGTPEAEVPSEVTLAGFRITAVPAAHEALDTDAAGRHVYLGYVVQAGPWTIYHSGDTLLYPGMEERLSPWGVDVALLPINGRAPERRVSGNLNGREAAELAKAIQAGCVIPCHFDMFTFNTASPDSFVEACRELDQPCRVLRVGERYSLENSNPS